MDLYRSLLAICFGNADELEQFLKALRRRALQMP
jgi:hypothetical protein